MFFLLLINILKDFLLIAVVIKKSRLVPFNTVPTGGPTPLANAATCNHNACDCIKSLHLFFGRFSRTSVSSSKDASILVTFSSNTLAALEEP